MPTTLGKDENLTQLKHSFGGPGKQGIVGGDLVVRGLECHPKDLSSVGIF